MTLSSLRWSGCVHSDFSRVVLHPLADRAAAEFAMACPGTQKFPRPLVEKGSRREGERGDEEMVLITKRAFLFFGVR